MARVEESEEAPLKTVTLHHIRAANVVGSRDGWEAHRLAGPHLITSWTKAGCSGICWPTEVFYYFWHRSFGKMNSSLPGFSCLRHTYQGPLKRGPGEPKGKKQGFHRSTLGCCIPAPSEQLCPSASPVARVQGKHPSWDSFQTKLSAGCGLGAYLIFGLWRK